MPKWRSQAVRIDVLSEADDAARTRNKFDFLRGGYSRYLTEVRAEPTIVTFNADGISMAVVMVRSGRNVVWRVRLADMRLSSAAFANAERAMRWIATGQALYPSEDEHDEKVSHPASSTTAVGCLESLDTKIGPEWETIEWRLRDDPIWHPGQSFSSKHTNST